MSFSYLTLLLLPWISYSQAFEEDYFPPHEFGLQNNIEFVDSFRGRKKSEIGLSYSWSLNHQYLFRKGIGINNFISYADRHFSHKLTVFDNNLTPRSARITTNFQVVELVTSIILSPFNRKRLFFSFGGGIATFVDIDFDKNWEGSNFSPNSLLKLETILAFEKYFPILFAEIKYSVIDNEDIRLFLASNVKVDFKYYDIGDLHLFQNYIYSFSVGFNVKIKPDEKSLFLNF